MENLSDSPNYIIIELKKGTINSEKKSIKF